MFASPVEIIGRPCLHGGGGAARVFQPFRCSRLCRARAPPTVRAVRFRTGPPTVTPQAHVPQNREGTMTKPCVLPPVAYHMVMFSFDGTETAAGVVKRLKAEDALAECEIEGEALISHEASGEVHFHEKGAAGIGAAFGAATAGVLGLVGGPVILLLMVAAGGIAGGVAGHFAGQFVPPEDLREVGESLPPDSSAYLAVVDASHADGLSRVFAAEGARVLNVPIRSELSCVLHETLTRGAATG